MDIEEARRRLAERPLKGDPTAMAGESLDEKSARLGCPEPAETWTEFGVRFEDGTVWRRNDRVAAELSVRSIQGRHGAATLVQRQHTVTDWTEAEEA